jgi:hypothetical protein
MEALKVKPYGARKQIAVKDSEGSNIHEGDYVQLVKDTTWHRTGEILLVTGASYNVPAPSIYIKSALNSSTAVPASAVRVATSEEVERNFKLAFTRNQLANIEAAIARANVERAGILETLRALGEKV